MPGIGDTRVSAGTGKLNFPAETKAAAGTTAVASAQDTSAAARQLEDLEKKVTLLSTALTKAQGEIAALSARIDDLEA